MINESDITNIRPNRSIDITQNSTLSILIPSANVHCIESLLRKTIECQRGNESPLVSIPQRQVLFFDENLDVYVALESSCLNENLLDSLLKSLIITIEAQVLNSQSESNDASQAHETIFTQSVQDIERPQFVIQVPNKMDKIRPNVEYFIFWKISIILDKLRLRFQSPSIIFSIRSTMRPGKNEDTTFDNQYLPSGVPSSYNILEAFDNGTSLNNVMPRLFTKRVSQIAPAVQTVAKSVCLLKCTPSKPLRIYPAIHVGIRYSKLLAVSSDTGVIASLEIATTQFADCEVIIKHLGLNIKEGWVEDLFTRFGLLLPVVCLPKDIITFTYFLLPNELDTKSPVRDVEISIIAVASLSDVCQPLIEMCWTSSLSFIPPINPGFGAPISSIKRSHRPFQLSIDNNSLDPKMKISELEASTPSPMTVGLQSSPSVTDFGITVTITSSFISNPIYPGVPFTWNVFISNRSDQKRKIALSVLCDACLSGQSQSQDASLSDLYQLDFKVANAVVDRDILLKMQKSSCRAAEIICLTSTQEIGPLLPMTCHEVELEFIALESGIIGVEAVRITDLDKNTHLDIKDLPIIYVSPIAKAI